MSLYRRNKMWWIHFITPNGKRVQESTGTRKRVEAQEYHDLRKAAEWRIAKMGDKPRRSWDEAVLRWLQETEHKASQAEDKRYLRWLYPYLGGKYLDAITREVMDEITRTRKAEGVSNATVNRTIQVARAILRRAALEWEWIDKAPRIRFLPEPKRRVRFLTKAEAERLLQALPEHLAEMARFTLATGLREANVVKLEWSQINLTARLAWIHPDQAKARKPIGVPLNECALTVLRRQMGRHRTRVFTFRGQPIKHKAGGNAWRKAVKRADIGHFRWHDLRHTWASWHAQAGTPLNVLQELGAWESVEMVRRYAHLAAHHLQAHAARLDSSTNLLQSPTEGHVSH